jgi:hypothetical protein
MKSHEESSSCQLAYRRGADGLSAVAVLPVVAIHIGQTAFSFSPPAALCQSRLDAVSLNGDPIHFESSHSTRASSGFGLQLPRSLKRTRQKLAVALAAIGK